MSVNTETGARSDSKWPQRRITDVIETIDQGWSPRCESGPSGSDSAWAVIKTTAIQHLRFLDAENKELPPTLKPRNHLELLPGDLLVTRAGPRSRVGVACLVKSTRPRLMLCDKAYRLRCKTTLVEGSFLELALNVPHIVEQINDLKTGISDSGVNLTQKGFGELFVPIPPLPDQRRIVAEIEKQFTRLEAGVAALRRVQANLKRYRAAVLKAACEGRLVPTEAELARAEGRPFESGQQLLARILTERRQNWQGRGNYKEPDAPDSSKLGSLPDSWEWATVAQLSSRVVDGTHHTPEYVSDGVAFISVKDIRGGIIHFDACKFISPQAHAELSKRCDVQSGDVLITKSGTIGRMAVVNTDRPFSLFVSVALIKPVRGIFDPKFLKVFLEGYIGSINISQDVKGALLKNLHLEDLRMVALRLPPLAEQTRIVAEVERRLSVVEELEAVVTTNLQRATRLRQAVLQKAFTGELFEASEMPFKT
jgi:type I restriction enzyme S subunit